MNSSNEHLLFKQSDYNKINISKEFVVFIPIFQGYPILFYEFNGMDITGYAAFFVKNLERVSIEILYSFKNFVDIENIFDYGEFYIENNMDSIHILYNGIVETMSYKNKVLIKSTKYSVFNQSNPFWELNIENHNKYIPIEKKNINGRETVNYFYFDICNDNLYYSFPLKEDKPFSITNYYENDLLYTEENYLISNIKNKRTNLYKPSTVVKIDSEVFDFTYLINNVDLTEKAIGILKYLDIKNPVKHNFSEFEIDYFVRNIL